MNRFLQRRQQGAHQHPESRIKSEIRRTKRGCPRFSNFGSIVAAEIVLSGFTAQSLVLAVSAGVVLRKAEATNGIYPVVDLQRGYLLGGSRDGQWLKAEVIAGLLKGREKYRLYQFDRYLGDGTGDKPKSLGPPCPEVPFITIFSGKGTPVTRQTKQAVGIGVGGGWNAMPRIPQLANTTQPVYLKIVGDLLRKHGIAKPNIQIRQIVRIDLEGDGTDEVLIAADHFAGTAAVPGVQNADTTADIVPSASQAGDYSLLLIRKEIKGRVKTLFIDQQYYPKARTFNAPSKSRVLGVVDLNGDGKMEIVVNGWYYEGDSTSVYTLTGDRLKEVLSSGCGA